MEGQLRVTAAEVPLSTWDTGTFSLGSAAETLPSWMRGSGWVGVVWAEGASVKFRRHADEDPPEAWSVSESVASSAVTSLSAAVGAAGEACVLGELSDGSGALWVRDTDGAWSERLLEWELRDPSLIPDASRGQIHLFYATDVEGRRLTWHRTLEADSWTFSDPRPMTGWPGVSQQLLLSPIFLTEHATDLVVASLGDDNMGYFGRVPLAPSEDAAPPITFQHDPPPGATGVDLDQTMFFRIADRGFGVDRSTLVLTVNGSIVHPQVRGVSRNLIVTYPLSSGLGPDVRVRIEATDLAPARNTMPPFEWQFRSTAPSDSLFNRGDVNDDGDSDVSDAVAILLHLFAGVGQLACLDAADVTDDGALDLTDSIYLLRYLFLGEQSIPAPSFTCGPDPTLDSLSCAAVNSC